MTEKVATLFGGPTGLPEPDCHCIAVLEDLLEKAHAGEIIAVAVAAKHKDGLATSNYGGKITGYAIIGALEMVKANLVAFNRD